MVSDNHILTIITARGGSKGVPRKNIRNLAGKPLIAWTIEAAQQSEFTQRIIVSTDDPDIASVSREYGAEVPFIRPDYLANDISSSVAVVLHAVEWLGRMESYRPNDIILLQPTSPFRSANDIDEAIKLQICRNVDAVVSMTKNERPLQWLRKIDENGLLSEVITFPSITRRQEAEQLYQINGAIYIIKTDVLEKELSFFPKQTLASIMSSEHSLDIDTELDFHIAELLMIDRQKKEKQA